MWLFEAKSGSRTGIEEVLRRWLFRGPLLSNRLFSAPVCPAGRLVGAVTSLGSLGSPQSLLRDSSRREK